MIVKYHLGKQRDLSKLSKKFSGSLRRLQLMSLNVVNQLKLETDILKSHQCEVVFIYNVYRKFLRKMQ